ncbi:MAG: quinolinate synthase NadA [Oscillospiraceae bacterium]|nr:quinolinate synthase NadA [Oscillospiraceae bacterium]
MPSKDLIVSIGRLKKERRAAIVAHCYQPGEVQDLADMVGDSYALAKFCAASEAETIVFCGVLFMAESAKVMSPEKTVLLPERDAGCPMADMVGPERVREMRRSHPGAAAVCYINTSAAVKAECDVCVTSSNAAKVLGSDSIKERDVIFLPDRNLGAYLAARIPGRNFILYDGYCPVHQAMRPADVAEARAELPGAPLLAHPECAPEVLALADFVGSTTQMIDYVAGYEGKAVIVATEMGVRHNMGRLRPDLTVRFVGGSVDAGADAVNGAKAMCGPDGVICPDMKRITPEGVHRSLSEGTHEIALDEGVRLRAKRCLDRMMELGG